MRVGKFLEHFQAALKATTIQDPVVSYAAIGRQLGYGFYLILDTLQWVCICFAAAPLLPSLCIF